MGQLKPSEVRLLILFSLTVLIVGSFFLYEWYARALVDVNAAKVKLQAEREGLLTMRQQQNEYNAKRVWLNQHQPVATNEFDAKEALDRVVSVEGINAAGLTLVSVPPERAPRLDSYFWAFERRVVVMGEIQNIVQWLASLQSESSFRAVTSLHIYPKKKKEPESLTCEVTIEQRYATEEILAMSHVGVVPASEAPMGLEQDDATSEGGDPAAEENDPAAEENEAAAASMEGTANEAEGGDAEARRVVLPTNGTPEVTTPRMRLPGPPNTGTTTPASPDADQPSGDEQTQVAAGANGGLLANSVRGRVSRGMVAPPPMAGDIAREERRAAESGRDPLPIETGIEPAQEFVFEDPEAIPEPTTIRVDDGTDRSRAPGPRKPFDTISVGGIVGEHWDENTPGAGGEEAEVGMEDLEDGPTN